MFGRHIPKDLNFMGRRSSGFRGFLAGEGRLECMGPYRNVLRPSFFFAINIYLLVHSWLDTIDARGLQEVAILYSCCI